MSYKFLDHTTDAFIEVTASTLNEAFTLAAQSVVDITLDRDAIEEKEQRTLTVSAQDLRYLLFDWLEEVNYQIITEGFSIARFSLEISKNFLYRLNATAYGEPINLKKHHFKIEIKAPTFHMMEIKQNGGVTMRFLMDL
ncbi:MAG: archease [Thaumarchaeota archaeon]|nr:archease [Nitrososphaerota archaeon]